jgi:hypothetical protein
VLLEEFANRTASEDIRAPPVDRAETLRHPGGDRPYVDVEPFGQFRPSVAQVR